MNTLVRNSVKRLRSANRRAITTILQSTNCISEIVVQANGRLEVNSIPWEQYWQSVLPIADESTSRRLQDLRDSRAALIESQFDLTKARSYCHAYFSLLALALEKFAKGGTDGTLLAAVLALECFPVRIADEGAPIAAAATTNVRNSGYLLSKLRCPRARDDLKFLPLITIASAEKRTMTQCPLFYHYVRLPT